MSAGSGPGVAGTVLRWVLLLAVWVLLWGELSVANLASGVVVVGAVTAVDARLRGPRRHRVRPWGVAVLLADLAVRLVVSSLVIARTVLRPTPERVREGVVVVGLDSDSDLVATVVADLITLTPGTLTLDVLDGPRRLVVHVFGLGDPAEVHAEVHQLERRTLRALQPLEPPGGAA